MSLNRLAYILILVTPGLLAQQKPATPYVYLEVPNFAKVGEPFPVYVSISPPAENTATVEMQTRPTISYSPAKIQIKPGQRKNVTATVQHSGSGIVWVYATAEGYGDGWNSVVVGFGGHLKLSSTGALPFGVNTTLSTSLVDSNGTPIAEPFDGELQLQLYTADGILINESKTVNRLTLTLPPGSRSSPEFQIRPKSYWGGTVHVNSVLTVPGNPMVLTQEDFAFSAEPAWWVPVLLAILGGLLHGVYKTVPSFSSRNVRHKIPKIVGVLIASAVAGFVGYLVADFDILGLKLDPNVLRTYPLVGFLFSYFGLEVMLRRQPAEQTSSHGAPRKKAVAPDDSDS